MFLLSTSRRNSSGLVNRQHDRSDCQAAAVAVGNAIGRTDKTRRLKPLLQKQSPPARTKEGILKSDLVTVNCQQSTDNRQQSTNSQVLNCLQSFGC
ncbi:MULTISPECIES: hypothetical protein [unclassified Microcoleus]|uniref:hypothetical protein n=1 Tax=unclassified Microcoleus TaxID=2642155 RepID=UPI002FD58CDD